MLQNGRERFKIYPNVTHRDLRKKTEGSHQHQYEPERPLEHAHVGRLDLFVFLLVGVAALVSWSGVVPRVGGVDLLAVTAVLGGGYSVFREALENLLARRMTMELSMTLALVAALAIGEFTTAKPHSSSFSSS